MNLTTSQLTKIGFAAGICFGVYKFVSNPLAKTAAVAVAAVIVARQVPYVGDALTM
jgi:hypothetical protein